MILSIFFHINFTIFNYDDRKGGDRLKYPKYILLLCLLTILASCSKEHFTPIDHHRSFVASMNILEPSLSFYFADGDIATWKFDKAYTGAMLLQHDRVLLYGHQLTEAHLYELSSGRLMKTINTGIGTTNAYYDQKKKQFFLSNSERNTVTSYDNKGNKIKELRLKNYPLSMASEDGLLYVINYKDTILSVVDIDSFTIKNEWEIEKSSNGIMIVPEEKTVWIGGHGEGNEPNQTIAVYNIENGNQINKIPTSLMPVEFHRQWDTIFSINHGSNEIYAFTIKGDFLWKEEVGANPFAVKTFQDEIVVASFDDHRLYFLKDNQVSKFIEVGKGPFQLLVREDNP